MSKKITRQLEFKPAIRQQIKERDRGCIFCRMNYHLEECSSEYERGNFQIMHYIPRSRMGLGIEQNGAVGCLFHHMMYDNGNRGRREEMQGLFRDYLKEHYSDWKEEQLVYQKYGTEGRKWY